MIDVNARLNLGTGQRVNFSYYQDFGQYPISDFRENVEDTWTYPAQKIDGSYIDRSDDVVVGTKSLVIYPPTASGTPSNPYNACSVKLNLFGKNGRGLFWVGTSGSGAYISIRYKKLDSAAIIQISCRNVETGSATSMLRVSSGGSVNTWLSASQLISSGWTNARYYVVITVSNGRVLLDGLQISATNAAFRTDVIDRTFGEYLLEGGGRDCYIKIDDIAIPDDQNGYVLDSGSVDLVKSIGTNGTVGGCNSNEFSCDVYDKGTIELGSKVEVYITVNETDYKLYTGTIVDVDRDFDNDWATIHCQDALFIEEKIDFFYRSYFDVSPDGYVGVWDSATVYSEGDVVLYNSAYYKYEFTVTPSTLYPATFKGSSYTSLSRLLTAMRGYSPDTCNYTYRNVEYSLPSEAYMAPYASKTEKTEYKGVWNSSTTYSVGDVVLYDGVYYKYGIGLDWYEGGVQYKTLLVGVIPKNIPQQFRNVSEHLISTVSGYDRYDYPLIPLGSFAIALLNYLNIPIGADASTLSSWKIFEYNQGGGTTQYPTFNLVYDPSLKNINAMDALRDLCQLCGKFGYIDENGAFRLISAYTWGRNVVQLGDNYVGNNSSSSIKVNSLEQVYMAGKRYLSQRFEIYEYPVGDVSNNVLDLSGNMFVPRILEYEYSNRSGAEVAKNLYNSLKDVFFCDTSIEEIVGVFVEPGVTVEITNGLGETSQVAVIEGSFKGDSFIDQTIKSENIVGE